MRNLYLLLLPALGLSFSVQSQLLQPAYSDSALHQNVIETEGVLEYQGTAMRGEFQDTLIFGGFINEEMKSRSFDRHGELNRLGGNGNGEIRYIHGTGRIFGRDTLTWMIKAGYTAIGNLQYGKDAFGLVFYGNSNYLGKTAVLTNTRLDCMQFQKIGFGLVSKKDKTSVTLNLVNVQNYAGGYVRKGEIEHAADGSQIDMTLNGDFRYGQGSSFSKGLGAAVDIDYRIRVPWFRGTFSNFQLSAQNLGFAYMYEGVKEYKADSAYSYNGFDFDAFRNSDNPLGKDFSLLDSLGIASRVTKRAVFLPGYIQVMKLVELNSVKKVQWFFGIRLYPSFSSVPLIFAGAYWKTARILHTSASLSYGGFGNLRSGVYATLVLSKVNVMIGTDNLAGVVSRSGFGESVVTRLIWKLN